MNTDELARRLDGLERQLRALQAEVDALRLELAPEAPPSLASFAVRAGAPEPPTVREPAAAAADRFRPFPPRSTAAAPRPASTQPPAPKRPRRELDLTE